MLARAALLLLGGSLFCAPVLARAAELGAGLEGGATATLLSSGSTTTNAGSGTAGLLLEQRTDAGPVEFTLWEDAQLAYRIDAGCSVYSCLHGSLVPVDAGLRLGWGQSRVHPYLGFLAGYDVLRQSSSLGQSFVAVGGDLGADVSLLFLRIGLEVRVFTNATSVAPASEGGSFGILVIQPLLSVRGELRL